MASAVPSDTEGLIGILEGKPQSALQPSAIPIATKPVQPTTATLDVDNLNLEPPCPAICRTAGDEEVDPEDWATDPVPTKLEKIRAAFLNSKSVYEVKAAAGNMPVQMWLECVIRLMPKDVKVQGEVGFRHMLEGLGPINPDQYRLGVVTGGGEVVEAEFKQISGPDLLPESGVGD